MTALTIRDVPEDQLRILEVRAARAGKSLNAYVLDLIARETSKPTLAETVARLDRETSAGVSTVDVLAAIDEGRERCPESRT
ncbi:antitoxin [Kitasatospora sp. NPDC059827]|uniref:FitA-like ribbon-helix-helix domain-containing protein n=1 Tax=Kitasatospora sp. NPDC059827 TaxID=3346964 RepID=UPI0036637C80